MNGLSHRYFIRHGETAWSLTGQHTGRTDLPLTPRGEAMARALAPRFEGIEFAPVLTSDRLRARMTCQLAGLGGRAAGEADLDEWDYGDYESLRTAEIRERHPDWNVGEDGLARTHFVRCDNMVGVRVPL